MFGFIAGFLLGIYFWRCWTWPRVRKVKPGLNKDVILPHTENLELHHNTLSSCSQKVCTGKCCFECQNINKKNNFCTQHVVNLYFSWNSMNNLSSYCRLTDSDTDLPAVSTR